MADVLRLAGTASSVFGRPRCLTREMIRELTTLGTIYVEAMPRYSFGAGLLDANNCLTAFGMLAYKQHNPSLDQICTQWLLHYNLSASSGPGPAFWHELVATRFSPGSEFTSADITLQVSELYKRSEHKPLAERSARATATAFLGTYSKPEALGRLGILRKNPSGCYQVLAPNPLPTWAFACIMMDYWQHQFANRLTINLDAITGRGSLADLLLISDVQLSRNTFHFKSNSLTK